MRLTRRKPFAPHLKQALSLIFESTFRTSTMGMTGLIVLLITVAWLGGW
jgi:hypothetical protein